MKKNNYWLAAGIINLLTALLHLIGGQIDLINPFLESNLSLQVRTELLGAWHMVTLLLFSSALIFIISGRDTTKPKNSALISYISYSYIGFSLIFIGLSIYYNILAPQWIILLPIGLLGLIGINKQVKNV